MIKNDGENHDGEVDDDGGVVLPSDWRKFPRPPPLSSLYSLPPSDLFVSFNVELQMCSGHQESIRGECVDGWRVK